MQIEYKGYQINVVDDDMADDPLRDMDVNYIINHGRHTTGTIEIPTLTREMIKDNSEDIANLLGYGSLLGAIQYNYGHVKIDDVVGVVNNLIDATVDVKSINEMYTLLTIAGIPCYREHATGYVQSAWHDILLTIDPDQIDEFQEPVKALESMANAYRLWVYGDVYGYEIKMPITCKCCNHTTYEDIDGCYGFIAERDDPRIVDEAKAVIDNL